MSATTTPSNLAGLLFSERERGKERDAGLQLLGCLWSPELRVVELSLEELRGMVLALIRRLAALGIGPGQTVALVRLPHTSELPVAVLYLALSAWGVRVLYPMYLELGQVKRWLESSAARALLVSSRGVSGPPVTGSDAALAGRLADVARSAGVSVLSFHRDLDLRSLLAEPPRGEADPELVAELLARPAGECLLLTTSGTSGQAKIVRYSERALLESCAAWQEAGFFAPDLLGGRGLCLLLGHSMGLRGLWNAIWIRQPLCLITPEWFLEHPERVSSLLLRMQPEHVTGGPTTFHTLLEFARVYPELKERCLRSLRCLVSSGAPFDPALARRVRSAFGLPLENALGLTETMQVTSTLAEGRYAAPEGSLGNPLPGVELRLDSDGLPPGQHRLEVRSPFGFSGYLDDVAPPSWFRTGDLVELRDGALYYLGREHDDFISDGLGLKIARVRLQQLYGELSGDELVDGVAFFPLRREPGLAALMFVPCAKEEGLVTDRVVLNHLQSCVEHRLERLRGELEELEFQHLSIGRFAALGQQAPRTVKGTLPHQEIIPRWPDLHARLTGRYTKHPGVTAVDRERYARPPAVRLTSPRLGELLHLLGLDRQLERAEGDRVYIRTPEGDEREVVDFVGGYGGNLLGHRHPGLLEALRGFLDGGTVPMFDQGSARAEQGELARRLSLLVGNATGGDASFVVRFGSTGAEGVEIALAHACLEQDEAIRRLVRDQKRRFGHAAPERVRDVVARIHERYADARPSLLALEGAYHGHSLGARSVVFSAKMRGPFARMSGIEPVFIPVDADDEELARVVARHQVSLPVLARQGGDRIEETSVPFSRIVAAIAEPLQGEGGVREVSAGLLDRLGRLDFPLILDEIQTGLGRTGRLLASPPGVRGAYYLFSKALGGGLAKIAAALIDRRRYVPRFDELYASTFAGDALSSAVAGRVLDLLQEERIAERCAERGAALRAALDAVQRAHPEVIRDVRGRGLMLAVELRREAAERSFALRCLAERELYGGLAAGYLLDRHGVRVLPTLSAPDVLRVEPSAYVDDEAIGRLAGGLRRFCELAQAGDAGGVLSYLVREENLLDDGAVKEAPFVDMPIEKEPPASEATRVAFILHFVFPERELGMVDPSLRPLTPAARRVLADRMMALMQLRPTVTSARNLFGGKVWFTVLLLPADVALLETLHRMDYRYLETERLQQAVDLGASLGCSCVALGGYTSILARDGTAVLPPPGVRITSGNTFTAVVGVRRLLEACRRSGIDPADARLGVVGGTGNIGSSLVRRLLSDFGELLLVGRSPLRLASLQSDLARPGREIEATTDLADLRRCNVIAVATNTNEPLIYPEHVPAEGAVVIADVSVPSAVSQQVRALEHVLVTPLAGTVAVPGAEDLVLSSHTAQGTAFCCAAEAMLIGLEPEATAGLRLTGAVDPRAMEVLDQLAAKHGFFDTMGEGGFRR
jgi:acetylornithine/succinyldiaminopimelate/putrescine aminotransferase/predicted amino acid dehydrogenase/acyl-coenzyme A synthetase/AMP-(fatty) acid ligase